MYKWIIIIFLSWISISRATNYYVDKNASGTNDGTSWTDAWESFADINWGSVNPGDFVYISGGTDSTIYYETLTVNTDGTADNRITIIAGKYAPSSSGHDGRVIIDGQNETRTEGININGNDYVTVKGFECREGTRGIGVYGTTYNVIIDSCYVYDFHGQSGIMLNGTYSSTDMDVWGVRNAIVRNCTIISFVDEPHQTDCLYIQCSINTTIHNNYIHNRNRSLVNSHSDGVQSHYMRGLKFYNNVVICDSAVQGMPVITRCETKPDYSDSVIFYNNFLYHGGLWVTNNTPWLDIIDQQKNWVNTSQEAPTIFINNTFVSHGPYVMGVWFERHNEQMMRQYNNIIAQYGDGDGGISSNYWHGTFRISGTALATDSTTGGLYYNEYEDFNVYGSGVTGNGNTGGCTSWSSWVNTYGGTGVWGDPLFVNYVGYGTDEGSLTGELQSTSPAINAGIDVQAIVEGMGLDWTDINGNARDNTPDIGAYQYVPRGPDITPPEVTGATLLDSVTLKIMFSEALDETTAEDENNYSISNNIDIFNASLNGSDVTLQTTAHSPGSYIVTVINVEDLAGNPISQSNTAEYSLIPPDSLIMFTIEDVQGVIQEPEHTPLKTIDGLGALSGDPDSRWAAQPMPEELIFDLGTNRAVSKTKLSFNRWNFGRVYTYSILISSDNNNWDTIVSQATSTLQEEWTIDEFPSIDARYVQVNFINNNENSWAGLWECEIWGMSSTGVDPINNGLPNEFLLYQNYPNPFNPLTKIRFSIPKDQPVKISIYNVLGELFADLTNQKYDAGTYTIDFDGSKLSSGIYFYRIETPEFIQTKKMILMK